MVRIHKLKTLVSHYGALLLIGLLLMGLGSFGVFIPIANAESATDLDLTFNTETLLSAEEIGQEIIRRYPTKRYHYIFIGRSLSLVRALMEVQGYKSTGLPLSGKGIDLTFGSNSGAKIKKNLTLHLRHYLPSLEQLNHKQIVALDFTASGAGLRTAVKILNWYYQGQVQVNTFSVSVHGLGPLNNINLPFLPRRYRYIISQRSMFFMHLLNSNFDSYAGYGKFNLNTGLMHYESQEVHDKYEILKKWLKQKNLQLDQGGVAMCTKFLSFN